MNLSNTLPVLKRGHSTESKTEIQYVTFFFCFQHCGLLGREEKLPGMFKWKY